MPRKTLALISGLVIVTVILFVVALKSSLKPSQQPTPSPSVQPQVTPIVPVKTTLNISPNPIVVGARQKGSVDVNIDTSDNEVTAIQLEIAYDPNFITNVKVAPGGLFQNPVLLIDKNSVKEGRYTYAFGIMPNSSTITGTGTVATITFTALNKPGQDSQLALLPTTLVTARGVSESVLKAATGTLITIGQSEGNVNNTEDDEKTNETPE